jgi:peptidyl-prolyl cis-trans isomerase C
VTDSTPSKLSKPTTRWRWAALAVVAVAAVGITSAAVLMPQKSTLTTPAQAQTTADPVVAKVDGTEIRQSDIALAEEELGANLPPGASDQRHEQLVAYVIDITLVAKAAEAKKVGEGKDFQQRLAFARNKLLMERMLTNEGKTAASDEAMRKVYDEAKSQMKTEEEVRARHILVETEEEANKLLAEIKGGADFAELAKQKSKDPSAAAGGGDLGYFGKEQMVPEFADVAFKMSPGQLSNPVKSQFGWHLIKVEDKRTKPMPEFDQVKEQIETFVTRRAQAELVSKLRDSARVERLDGKPAEQPKSGVQPKN